MKPSLTFQTEVFNISDRGEESSVPDLIAGSNIQNKTKFFLDEEDEIYEGYGKLYTSYPYRQYTCYNRNLHKKELKTAVLENDFLKAVFLPELGGRLWSLIDKTTGQNLLYTNDVIRPGNLAIRNAWFSGGVEWNISMIGHTPFTMEPLFTASLTKDDDTPVLRMYEYERVRKVTYQMDFWLGKNDRFLNCRMRISNQTEEVVPMYWWSNIAVPEYDGGRIIVPAKEAYTNRPNGVYKVSVPIVDGHDISKYKEIPDQVDYFFNIPKASAKYIANITKEGYGLLHLSTSRLMSRKLFSWGNNEGSDNWQNFLTEHAGRYIEIQGGLAKTQYGCLPMAPHTAWEWMELYGPVQVSSKAASSDYESALQEMNTAADKCALEYNPESTLIATKSLARQKGKLLYTGHGYGAFECRLRLLKEDIPLSEHLDFGNISPEYETWISFLKTGIFPKKAPEDSPFDFISDHFLFKKLKETIDNENVQNWYAHYQLGLYYLTSNRLYKAKKHLETSLSLTANPWALHALSALHLQLGEHDVAAAYIKQGYSLRKDDLSYLKETWKILLLCEKYETIKELYHQLPADFAAEERIHFGFLTALARTGQAKEVLDSLNEKHLVLSDLRECEDSLGSLWEEVYEQVHKEKGTLPKAYNYHSLVE